MDTQRIIPVTQLRANLKEVTDWVETEKKPVILTKNGNGRFVLLDIDTYHDLEEKAARASSRRSTSRKKAAADAEELKREQRAERVRADAARAEEYVRTHEKKHKDASARQATGLPETASHAPTRPRPQDPDNLTEQLREREQKLLESLWKF